MLPFVFKTFVLSDFEWPLQTGFTVHHKTKTKHKVPATMRAITNNKPTTSELPPLEWTAAEATGGLKYILQSKYFP